jgi:hypothetical protein
MNDMNIFKLQLNHMMYGCLDVRDHRKVEDDLTKVTIGRNRVNKV